MKRLLLVLVLSTSPLLSACHAPVTITTAAGKTAYTADQIVMRIGELENAVIQANSTGALNTDTTRKIVEFCVSSAATLKSTPSGWQATVSAGWKQLKPVLAGVTNPALLATINAADVVLATLGV